MVTGSLQMLICRREIFVNIDRELNNTERTYEYQIFYFQMLHFHFSDNCDTGLISTGTSGYR